MIAVDTSALMAIVLGEPKADACIDALDRETDLVVSAGTLAEAFIVAARRNVADEMERLVTGLGFAVVPVTEGVARRVATIYAQWGKGIHPAALNFGDCFAYVAAKDGDCPLLYVGDDFAQTEVASAL